MGAGPTFNGLLFSDQCAGIHARKPLIQIQLFLLHCCVYECLHGESCQFKILQKKSAKFHSNVCVFLCENIIISTIQTETSSQKCFDLLVVVFFFGAFKDSSKGGNLYVHHQEVTNMRFP